MSDDRRLGPRRWAHVTAIISHNRLGMSRCMLRDISLEGAFVETGGHILDQDERVELVLKLRAGHRNKHCRVPAKVARVSDEGAALIFDDPDEQLYSTLFDIVHIHLR
ncbi:MAG: PilZ domain-containing protein [Gammaproteobacteria bacterium]|nr:PilZ domain-containing protein [Gammaproteobacteria bacterium]